MFYMLVAVLLTVRCAACTDLAVACLVESLLFVGLSLFLSKVLSDLLSLMQDRHIKMCVRVCTVVTHSGGFEGVMLL